MRVEDGENYDDLITRVDAALALLRPCRTLYRGGIYFLRTMVARVILGDALSGSVSALSQGRCHRKYQASRSCAITAALKKTLLASLDL